jgi:hypothetical protein
METLTISFEEIQTLLPKRISLYYVHYNNNLDERSKEMQDCIQNNNLDAFYELVDDWYSGQNWESVITYIKEELRPSLMKNFNLSEKEAKHLTKDFFDEIRESLEDRDDSDPISDLIRNTGDIIFFYETGISTSGYDGSKAEHRLEKKKIKKLLSITSDEFDKEIESMLCDASYGGQLVIYFRERLDKLITTEEYSHIRFTNATIAIIDTAGGSGGDCYLPKHSFTLEFKRDNLFVEKSVHYNYTYQVCGMYEDWCDSTKFEFLTLPKKGTKKVKESKIAPHMQREKFLNAVWAKGICTPGDMNMNRHKETQYINEFPCGTRCKKCNTFWID